MMRGEKQFLAGIQDLAPVISSKSAEIDDNRCIPNDLLAQLIEFGCFRMLVPRSHGGYEYSLPCALQALEGLARADGSVGWTMMIAAQSPVLLGLLPLETFDEVYRSHPDIGLANSSAARGQAELEKGGFRVTGTWPFASGILHSTWIMGHCTVTADGNPRNLPNGEEEVRSVLLPISQAEILDTWDTMGLRGTGSHDFKVNEVFVPTNHTFLVQSSASSLPGPLFALPIRLHFALHMAAVALGIAQAALDTWIVSAAGRKGARHIKRSAESLVEPALLGHADSELCAARSGVHSAAARAWQVASEGRTFSASELVTLRAASIYSIQVASSVVDRAFAAGGSRAIFRTSPLQRYLRDIHTLAQHANLSQGVFANAGLSLMDVEIDLATV